MVDAAGPQAFLALPASDRAEILNEGEARLNRSAQVLEKDVWVCWVLEALFGMVDRPSMAFKGGTSLSKVYRAIARFSEDVDITVDYRFFEDAVDPLAPNMSRTKVKEFSDRLRQRHLPAFIQSAVLPQLRKVAADLPASEAPEFVVGDDAEGVVEVVYSRAAGTVHEYVRDRVLIELGARNATRPAEPHMVVPYLADLVTVVPLAFPRAQVDVLSLERTFWEKVTLVHAENTRSGSRRWPDRYARHWYDLHMLVTHLDIGAKVLAATGVRSEVIALKSVLFRYGGVDYGLCERRAARLVPGDDLIAAMRDDYDEMQEAGMFEDAPPAFEELMRSIAEIEDAVNRA